MNSQALKWDMVPLKDICENLDSQRIPITKSKRKGGNIPYYGASGVVDHVAEHIFDEDLLLVSEDGANLLARTYPIAFSISGKTWVNNHAHALRFERMESQKFIEYYLNSISLKPYVSGMAQPKLNQKSLKSISVPFPPLPEQQRIVSILDEVFEGIGKTVANAERNLENSRELFENYLNGVFKKRGKGWGKKRIDEIAQVKGGKRVPKGYKLQAEPTEHPYLTVADFNGFGSVDVGKLKYINDEVYSQISRYTISPKDLYLSIAGTIGKTGIIPESLNGANLTENACKLVFNEGVNNRFIYYFTLTSSFSDQALRNTRVAAQPKLALTRLKTIELGIPSEKHQQQIVSCADELQKQIQVIETIYRRKISILTELKQSILQKAFTGELTSKTADRIMEPA